METTQVQERSERETPLELGVACVKVVIMKPCFWKLKDVGESPLKVLLGHDVRE